jgi:hypothetical protein
MAETQKGGAYMVDGKIVDANGVEVKLTSKGRTDSATGDAPPAPAAPTVYVEGVTFGSDAAGQTAKEAGLTAEDFKGYTPSGQEGYTKPDVAKVLASKQAVT